MNAPVLTADMLDDVESLSQLLDPGEESNGELQRALQALADGRTACVRVMSEAEIREWFDEWVETAGAHGHRIGAVLAFARAMGAVR